MDMETFVDIISEERSTQCSQTEGYYGQVTEETLEYKPYIECPRCSNWQLAARVHREREEVSRGFLRGSKTVWRDDRWWECKECGGTFDVAPTEELEENAEDDTDDTGEETDDTGDETDDADETPELYELSLIDKGANGRIPVDGGEKGVVRRRSNVVRVPAASAKFRLPLDEELPTGTEVRILRRGDDVYCKEE